jgi:hypothetical protein
VKGLRPELKESAQLVNLVALSLKKEIDFAILSENKVKVLMEVKLSDPEVSGAFLKSDPIILNTPKVQRVKNLYRPFTARNGTFVEPCLNYIENLDLKADVLQRSQNFCKITFSALILEIGMTLALHASN